MLPSSGSICKACADCLSHLHIPARTGDHYQHLNLEGVRQAAVEGCRLCSYIELLMGLKGCCRAPDVPFEFFVPSDRAYPFLHINHKCNSAANSLATVLPIKANACEIPPILEATIFGQSTQSAHCQALAKRWMHSCMTSHNRCADRMKRLSNLESSQLPARLLDLQGARATGCIRVVHTKTEKIKGPYVTLSHCWGLNPLIKLRNTNLKHFSRKIEIMRLPQTFRDAIEICAWYDFRYIWIDSLCIVQDSKADWETESAAMKKTYSHSILNIAASSAVNSSYGLFKQRTPDLQIPLLLDVPKYGTCVLHTPMDTLSESITEGPLASRGWVLQEWLLAPRVLHFGEQLFWECPEILSCETFPLGSPDRSLIPEPEFFTLKRLVSSLVSTHDGQLDAPRNNAELYQAWRSICREYSRRDLSVDSDKIVALSGVADLFQSILTDTFMTGLWRSTFIPDMCWLSLRRRIVWDPLNVDYQMYAQKPARPPEYGAPSWSWMSVSNEIHWYPHTDKFQELAILCCSNRNCSHEESMPKERSPITVFGVLRPAKWKLVGKDRYGQNQFQFFLDGIKAFDSTIQLDADFKWLKPRQTSIKLDDLVDDSFPVEEIFFLPLLATSRDACSITGIILCQAGESQFHRLGYFDLFEVAVFGTLFFELKSPTKVLDDPWNYFLEYAKNNKTVEGSKLLSDLFREDTPNVSNADQLHESQAWQAQDIQQALGPYDESMFQPLVAQEIHIV